VTHRRAESLGEFLFILRGAVSQGSVGAVPHILCRVEFGRIGWEIVWVDPGASEQKVLDQVAPMNRAAIPE
jgi:hypothetical protein